jgi:hypothetical protein
MKTQPKSRSVKIDEETYKMIKKIAIENDRTISATIRFLMKVFNQTINA